MIKLREIVQRFLSQHLDLPQLLMTHTVTHLACIAEAAPNGDAVKVGTFLLHFEKHGRDAFLQQLWAHVHRQNRVGHAQVFDLKLDVLRVTAEDLIHPGDDLLRQKEVTTSKALQYVGQVSKLFHVQLRHCLVTLAKEFGHHGVFLVQAAVDQGEKNWRAVFSRDQTDVLVNVAVDGGKVFVAVQGLPEKAICSPIHENLHEGNDVVVVVQPWQPAQAGIHR